MKPTDVKSSAETSNVHRIGAGRFARELFRRFAPWWMWVAVALFAAGFILGLAVDLMLMIVGFMILLVILPPALAFCYYSHALCRECFINTLPHTVAVADGSLAVSLYVRDEDSDDGSLKELRTEYFAPESVTGYELKPDSCIIELRDRNRGFLVVPASEFDNPDDYTRLTEWFRESVAVANNNFNKITAS